MSSIENVQFRALTVCAEQAVDAGRTSEAVALTDLRNSLTQLRADARALWAVRVLDRWQAKITDRRVNLNHYGKAGSHPGWSVQLVSTGCHRGQHFGSGPDAARIAAAEALVAEDPKLDH